MAPGVKAHPMAFNEVLSLMQNIVYAEFINDVRTGENKESKFKLPAIAYQGQSVNGQRAAKNMKPTQLVMVDLDHCTDAHGIWDDLCEQFQKEDFIKQVACAHYTPSQGLRVVFKAQPQFSSVQENQAWWYDHFKGCYEGKADPDRGCFNLDRVSYLVPFSEFLYYDFSILDADIPDNGYIKQGGAEAKKEAIAVAVPEPPTAEQLADEFKQQEEMQKKFPMEYRGTPVGEIIQKYVEWKGAPSSGEVHNYYNEMAKNFRNIMSNNPNALLAWLPRFGHTAAECEDQVRNICSHGGTLSRLPGDFYWFLRNHGYVTPTEREDPAMKKYLLEGNQNEWPQPPYLPPVFREFCKIAPKDFVIPTIEALLPIMGTLTSYVQARYPYDGRMHTTSFFSVIYAPAGTGKGFVERLIKVLFENLELRDMVSAARENIYANIINKKGSNEKAPDNPHVSLRILPPKNSEAEFLRKTADNHGYHMFTYAAEMDSWAKGVKAAGGNKDDMIRIAWDNEKYGQAFASPGTVKGLFPLYWNVLITGTLPQLEAYFKNVENGLVTRCSFSSIENQEFALPPQWKEINRRGMEVIRKFMDRCDENTYEDPCTVDPAILAEVPEAKFDDEIPWRFKFKERQTVDCSWIMPTIAAFHDEQVKKAARDVDKARDVFRRRTGVRGFRLALICMCLWEKPSQYQLDSCKRFIDWYMHVDLEMSLKLWGAKYNELSDSLPTLRNRVVFDNLSDEFSKADMIRIWKEQGIKTPIRGVLYQWRKLGVIRDLEKGNRWAKVKRKNDG